MTEARDTEPLDCSKPHSNIEGNLQAPSGGPPAFGMGFLMQTVPPSVRITRHMSA
jgi:hypothetical protein